VYSDDVLLVLQLFHSLVRDHCGVAFADFAWSTLNQSLDTYAQRNPSQVKPSFDFGQERRSLRAVRTAEEFEGRDPADVEAEIRANADEVRRSIGAHSDIPPYTPRYDHEPRVMRYPDRSDWWYPDDVYHYFRGFLRLILDHADQRLCDYFACHFLATTYAYRRAHPTRISAFLCTDAACSTRAWSARSRSARSVPFLISRTRSW